ARVQARARGRRVRRRLRRGSARARAVPRTRPPRGSRGDAHDGSRGLMALVVVDAENVRRSVWPNPTPRELVARAREWAEREGHELLVVFDGPAPEDAPDLAGSPYADDEIAGIVRDAAGEVWVVTSDRGLRDRVPRARLVGGGTFARELLA